MTTAHPRRGRLVLLIYAASVGAFVVIFVGFSLMRSYLLPPPWRGFAVGRARYVVGQVAELRGDPARTAEEVERVHQDFQTEVTLYDPAGQRLAGPALPAPRVDLARLARGDVLASEDARVITVPIVEGGRLAAFGVARTPARDQPAGPTVVYFGLVLVCLAVTALLLARSLAVPLVRLSGVARAFGRGDLHARARIRRRDEIGELAVAFDEMAERITGLLRSQTELLANVSHELRTPMARIRVAVELAAEGDHASAGEALAEIGQDLDELERLVDDVLTAARLDLADGKQASEQTPLRREPVDPQTIPDRALAVEAGGELPRIDADAALLRRAVDNLLDNAAKYSDAGTPVTLRARAEGGDVLLEVADHGIGIDEADRARIFEPFYRADRSRTRSTGGVGLGLFLVRRIVAAHGGTIAVASKVGEGTTMTIRVPRARPA